ncbi:MAG: ribonuclease III [Vulcanimicrobiaceae bacterium]
MAGENRRRRLRALLEIADLPENAFDAIEPAFVHESAAREGGISSNERLEFLGDAILGMIVASWLYANYPDDKEGVLAKRKAAIVSDRALAASAKRLGFADLVQVGTGERAHGGNERVSILADSFEAFIASIYRHFGVERARAFVEREHIAYLDHATADVADAKTQLQEFTQEHFACMPLYREEGEGPAHERVFTATVTVNDELLGTGTGSSKKAAQQDAAAQALHTLQARI